jgi:hypothetical protein
MFRVVVVRTLACKSRLAFLMLFSILAVGASAVLPAGAAADTPPVVTTTSYASISPDSGVVSGTVNPDGDSTTTYDVLYDTVASGWCDPSTASGVTPMQGPTGATSLSGASAVSVTIELTGLTAGTQYCVAIEAKNTDYGDDVISTPLPAFYQDEPTATSGAYVSGSPTGGVLGGTVDAGADSTTSTSYGAVYDLQSSTWCKSGGTTGTPNPSNTVTGGVLPAQATNQLVSVTLSGLSADTPYCAAIEATNDAGTTISTPVNFTQGAPVITATSYTSTSASGGVFTATLDPNGDSTTEYQAVYAPIASSFCTPSGTSVAPTQTGYTALKSTVTNVVTVSVSGLTAQSGYCIALEATGATGQADQVSVTSAPIAITQDSPSVTAPSYQSSSSTGGTLSATINPYADSSSTTYEAVYAPSGSAWCTTDAAQGSATASPSSPVALGSSDNVSVTLSLTADTSYCAAIEATSDAGTTISSLVTLVQGAPVLTNSGLTEVDPSDTTITASINPSGQSTSYYVAYDTAGSAFCGGTSTTATYNTSTVTLKNADTTTTPIAVELSTGISPKGSYCAQLISMNSSGKTDGPLLTFIQQVPGATTTDAYSTGATTAVVEGTVNPDGLSTTYYVAYDQQGSDFCAGTEPSDSTTVDSPAAPGVTLSDSTGTQPDSVTVDLTGLIGGTNYCFAIVAENSYGLSTNPGQGAFALGQGDPLAETFSVTDTGPDTAEVDGAIDPIGQSFGYEVLYDTQGSAFCNGTSDVATYTSSLQRLGGSIPSGYSDYSLVLYGLTPNQAYCAAMIGVNNSGYTQDPEDDVIDFVAGDPVSYVEDVQSLTASSAEVDGEVDWETESSEQPTTYYVGYDVQGSNFCMGLSNTPSYRTSPAVTLTTNTSSGTAANSVSVDVNGLTPKQNYCAALIAHNTAGNSQVRPFDFTAGVPAASTTDADGVEGNVATIEGAVSPAGQSTQYYVYYGLESSSFCQDTSSTPGGVSSSATLAGTAPNSSPVTINLSGLSINTTYCAIMVASNASGTSPYDPVLQSVQFTTNSTIVSTGGGSSGAGGSSGGSGSTASGSSTGSGSTITQAGKTGLTSAQVDAALKSIALPSGKLGTVASVLGKTVAEKFTAPGAGTLRIVWTVKYKRKTRTIASSTVVFSAAGKRELKLRLNATGRRLLKLLRRHVAVTVAERFAPTSGAVGTSTRHFTLK